MNGSNHLTGVASPRELQQRLVDICDMFEKAWRSELRPSIEDFLAGFQESERSAILRELIALELRLRHEIAEQPTREDYLSQFPQDATLVDSAFESYVRERHGAEGNKTVTWTPPEGQSAEGSPRCSETEAELDKRIGRYLVLNQLGEGGQAKVFRVIHPTLQGEFVLKLAHEMFDPCSPQSTSLRLEAQRLSKLEHPNLARVIDLDFHNGHPFVVMEYVRGRTLEQHAKERSPNPRDVAGLVAELIHVVEYLHAQGIVHQDVTPRNVVLDEKGRPRLIDLGLARISHAWSDESDATTGGSPQYMSPEQARGDAQRVGPRSDIFSLGGVLYYLLCGKPPFQGADRNEARRNAARCDFDRQGLQKHEIPKDLARVTLKALEAKPEDRYPTAAVMGRRVQAFLDGPRKRRKVAQLSAIAALGLLVASAGLLAWTPWNRTSSSHPTHAAPAVVPLRVEQMQISHFREKPEFLHLGTIGTLSASTVADDLVRMRVQLSAPAHCYLIALHPNGETQLYYPESEAQPPSLVSEFVYPPDDEYSPLTDGVGLQAYVLIASRAPLPAYREWKKHAGEVPWSFTEDETDGVWLFDGLAFHWVKSGMRSQPRALQKTPAAFESACRYFEQSFDGDVAIQAWAFPVMSKNPARAASQ